MVNKISSFLRDLSAFNKKHSRYLISSEDINDFEYDINNLIIAAKTIMQEYCDKYFIDFARTKTTYHWIGTFNSKHPPRVIENEINSMLCCKPLNSKAILTYLDAYSPYIK